MALVAPLASRPSAAAPRLDMIAVVWGGLVASIGLMAGAGRDWPARLIVAALSFAVGGFLAGVRAANRRILHAFAAWFAAYVIHACFIALARLVRRVRRAALTGTLRGRRRQLARRGGLGAGLRAPGWDGGQFVAPPGGAPLTQPPTVVPPVEHSGFTSSSAAWTGASAFCADSRPAESP